MSQIQLSRATLAMAVITFVLAIYIVLVEAFVQEDLAKALVTPPLYALIFSSGMTIFTLKRTKSSPYYR